MAKTAPANAAKKPAKAATKMVATPSTVTPAKAEIKKKLSKKKQKKLKRYKIKVETIVEGRIWVFSVIDRRDKCMVSIDAWYARYLFKGWLQEHYLTYPSSIIGGWSFDQKIDAAEVVIQTLR